MRTNIEEVFNLNDEHKIFEFCKDYALNNPEFAEILIEHFLPKKSSSSKDLVIEIDKELEQCFSHIYDKYRDKYRSTKFDWHVIDEDLYRLILRGKYLFTNGLVYEAIYLALGLLRRVGERYIEDLVYQEQDLDGFDFSTQDAASLLEVAMNHRSVTKKDMLKIADELEKIGELEAYDSYCLCNFGNLLESIKKSQLSEEDYMKHLKSDMNKAADLSKGGYATTIFNFMLENNRTLEAENWAKENLLHTRMIDKYVDWLIGNERLNDALLILDIGIKQGVDTMQYPSDWFKKRLEIYESLNDTIRIIEQCSELFTTESMCISYYRKLKAYIDKTEWSNYFDELLRAKKFNGDASGDLPQICFEEKRYAELFQTLEKADWNLLQVLQSYATVLTCEQQTILIVKIERELIDFGTRRMGRDNYKELARRLDMLKNSCDVGKNYSAKLVEHFRANYYNRPAMMDELMGC